MDNKKIYYIHGTMYSGKSLDLISTYKTYEYQGKMPLVLKHSADTRDYNTISSRMSNETIPCITFDDDTSLVSLIETVGLRNYPCIMIDEVQFCSLSHIQELNLISKYYPIMCYGLKTSYTGELFPSVAKLIPLAENIKEIKTTCCMCSSKATHNLLVRNDKPIYKGAFVNIEGANNEDKYYAVCREHFYEPIL